MKLLRTESPAYDKWKEGRPSGKLETIVQYINPEYIVTIEHYKGSLLHEGWQCSKITYNEGGSRGIAYDARQPHELYELLTGQ